MIEPACSAAFPTIGSKIMLIKLTEMPQESEAAWLTIIYNRDQNFQKITRLSQILCVYIYI